MKIRELKITPQHLSEVAQECYNLFHVHENRKEILRSISDRVSDSFGDFLNPYLLSNPDNLSIGFIELLDQILFEMEEVQNVQDEKIEEYIIDDLTQRLESYLYVFHDLDEYKKNLKERIPNFEDILIIKHYHMKEMIPMLMSEFFEQPNIRSSLLKALVCFKDDDLLPFFYEIAKNEHDAELKTLAIIGLKNFDGKFSNWSQLGMEGDPYYQDFISHTCSFNSGHLPEITPDQVNLNILLFHILYIELHLIYKIDVMNYKWIIEVLHSLSMHTIENLILLGSIYHSISNIITRIHCDTLKETLSIYYPELVRIFIEFIDSLPVEIFDRIMNLIDHLGESFVSQVERSLASGEIMLNRKSSNLLGYLFSIGLNPIYI